MRTLLLIVASLGAILLFLLASASSNNTAIFSQYYWQLFGLNALLASCLCGVLIVQLYTLRKKVKTRVFGSRLTLRLTMTFALVAVVPGLLIYILSVQFLTRSIDTWFDVRVDTALERGLNLGQTAIDYSLQDLERRGRIVAQVVNDNSNDISVFTQLAQLRKQLNIQEMTLLTLDGKVLAHLADNPNNILSLPNHTQLQQAEYKSFFGLETDPSQRLIMRAIVPIHVNTIGSPGRVLQLIQPVPERLAIDAELVDQIRNEYKQLSLSRNGLKAIYSLTLTLAFLMLMLGVFILAIYLSDKLSAPLGLLAAGTRAVAQGDFSQQQPVVSRDELGILTHSFNRMTRQLADARISVEHHQAEQAAAKAYLETILRNMTAGVLSFDEDWKLRAYNDSAIRILGHDLAPVNSTPLPDWEKTLPELAPFCQALQHGIAEKNEPHWQQQITLPTHQQGRVLLVHCALLQKNPADTANRGYVMVFDDITNLISAQRDAAWGEVARRLAHEIKNPLTPIQLAAERLEHKLKDKLSEKDADFLARSAKTIVNQVTALKHMVDSFKEYARQPTDHMQVIDLQEILNDVLTLYENTPLEIKTDGTTPMLIYANTTLLRQLIHNLLQNAQDAVANTTAPKITISTKQDGHFFILSVSDNGSGFPDTILPRVFEPYATSKPKGTGLGLAIVKKIVEAHQGRIHVGNQPQGGAYIQIDLPCWEEGRE